MVTDVFLTSLAPLLIDRITGVEDRTLAEMLLIASLHLDYQPAAVLAFARDVENTLAVFLGQTEMLCGYEINIHYLHIRKNHVEKSDEYILVGLAAEKPLEHEVALKLCELLPYLTLLHNFIFKVLMQSSGDLSA